MRAIQVQEFGGPEVLEHVDLPDPVPGEGEVLLDVSSAGINYADTHQAEDSYLSKQELPFIPGTEVVGVTPDGERLAGFTLSGGYASKAVVNRAGAVPVPDGVSDTTAVGLLVQGLTAWHLLRTSARMAEGDTVVVHAAAGGVGSLVVQLARAWGAGTIVGTASSPEKRELAVELGADLTVDSRANDMNAALRDEVGGKVDVVIDMVGGHTTDGSLRALAPFGRHVVYGMASREAPTPIDVGALMARSQAVVGFWLVHALQHPATMIAPALAEMLGMIGDGSLRVIEGGSYPLAQARRAHEDLRARVTTGKLVLDCS